MSIHPKSKLNPRQRYLQIALNSTLDEAHKIINSLPISDRIIVEAGTPLIKRYGAEGIRKIHQWYSNHLLGVNAGLAEMPQLPNSPLFAILSALAKTPTKARKTATSHLPLATSCYIVADLKTMDRGGTEVEMAAEAGASAAVALGSAPKETLDAFIAKCEELGLDPMIDMMNVEYPLNVLRALKKVPPVVILHRGVDEEELNRQKQIPLHEIRRIKGNFNIMISIAGGDTLREVERSIFNDADIVVVWKSVYEQTAQTMNLINGFLKEIK
ncbi:MAG: orotidine 5'-phosphate decarboxylase / HUMPS family protein [Patescibacteria group bacterium]